MAAAPSPLRTANSHASSLLVRSETGKIFGSCHAGRRTISWGLSGTQPLPLPSFGQWWSGFTSFASIASGMFLLCKLDFDAFLLNRIKSLVKSLLRCARTIYFNGIFIYPLNFFYYFFINK